MKGKLTTHILDTANGIPAEGVRIELFREGEKILETVSNQDGRSGQPLLEGAACVAGEYEILFHLGDYYARRGESPSGGRFLDRVPIRFHVLDGDAHYHVPLLASPWSYSTYRGS